MDRIGKFWTSRGYFYRAKVIAETPTHWSIEDLSTGKRLELLKTTVDRVEWEVA
jgi:hypothetical protein